jgi:hypothetical protein
MRRLGWALFLVAIGLAGFAFHWLRPAGNEYSLFDIDVEIGSEDPFDATMNRLAVSGPLAEAEKEGRHARGFSGLFDTSRESFEPQGGCLAEDGIRGAQVVGLGAYEGGAPVELSFVAEGHEVRRIAVQANNHGKPLLLVLTAYDPVMWDFAGFPMERLRGVLVYGYSEQAVANLDPTVPIRFVTQAMGATACGTAVYPYKQSAQLQQLRQQVRKVLGVPLQAFYGSYSPDAIQADGASFKPLAPSRLDKAKLKTSAPTQEGGLLPGEPGLRQLLDRGDIRAARPDDVAEWHRRSGEKHGPATGYSFVVLRKTELPRGMYGAQSRDFIIPNGVPLPSDPGSHNQYFLLKDGSCVECR